MSFRTDILDWLDVNGYPANVAFCFEEGSGTPTDAISGTKQPTVTGSPTWDTDGTYGTCYKFDTADKLVCLTTSGGGNNFGHFLSTTSQTVIVARKKTDTTARQSYTFAANTASTGGRCSAHIPWNDNIVYWDFGNNA